MAQNKKHKEERILIKRTTANLPADLINEAMQASGLSMTETIIEGLKLVKRLRAYELAQQLKGKLKLEIDLNRSRERYNS